jgi:hypothetical protein
MNKNRKNIQLYSFEGKLSKRLLKLNHMLSTIKLVLIYSLIDTFSE